MKGTRCSVTDRKWTARFGRSKSRTADNEKERARLACVELRNSQRISLNKKKRKKDSTLTSAALSLRQAADDEVGPAVSRH